MRGAGSGAKGAADGRRGLRGPAASSRHGSVARPRRRPRQGAAVRVRGQLLAAAQRRARGRLCLAGFVAADRGAVPVVTGGSEGGYSTPAARDPSRSCSFGTR